MGATKADFSGYATKAGLKCSDGRTITADAFKHMDKVQIPLVWSHNHTDPENILGHAILEARDDGMYAYGYFNNTSKGQTAKEFVSHRDVKSLSIWANQLVEKIVQGGKQVLHGQIKEVSLVLAGANPGALIDWIQVQHSEDPNDTSTTDEAIIHTGLELEFLQHDTTPPVVDKGPSAKDVYDTLSDDQKTLMTFMVTEAVNAAKDPDGDGDDDAAKGVADDKAAAAHSDKTNDLIQKEGTDAVTNVFDQTDKSDDKAGKRVLSHAESQGIFADALKNKSSLKDEVDAFALKHGITPVDILFPNFQNLTNTPQFNSRRMEWVQGVLDGTSKSPFSRVRSIVADITQDQARALGYIKGTYKKEEWFTVTKRTTSPTTVYKKQRLDRDDIIDITDFDVVAWMKGEMTVMLKEELGRAILIGDGRDVDDDDKIKDPMAATDGVGVRSILNEHELYCTTVNVNLDDAASTYYEAYESILRARRYYKGTGTPTFYTTALTLVEMLLTKDAMGRRYWNSPEELAAALMVDKIVPVEVMETIPDLVGIIVNLGDYNIGADKGGEVNLFDFFDIDYNQYKYLIETRISGALTKVKSALIVKKTAAANVLVAPTKPTFVKDTGVVTIPTKTGVVYTNADTATTLTAGAQTALAAGVTLNVQAVPATGYYFSTNADDLWPFTRPAA
jgi:hypothetical protein